MLVNAHLAAVEIACGRAGAPDARQEASPEPLSFDGVRCKYGPRFRRATRMSVPCFSRLMNIVRPHMPPREMSLSGRVFVALRYYAEGSYSDVSAVIGVSPTTFLEAIWVFTDSVLCAPELQMQMPLWEVGWLRQTAVKRRSGAPGRRQHLTQRLARS